MIQETRAGAEQFSDFLENCWKLFNRYGYKPDLRKSSKGEVLRGMVEEHLELRDAIHGGDEDEVKAEAMDNVIEAFRAWHWAVRGCPSSIFGSAKELDVKPPWRLEE